MAGHIARRATRKDGSPKGAPGIPTHPVLRPTGVSHMRLTNRRADPHPPPPRHAAQHPALNTRHAAGRITATPLTPPPHMRRKGQHR
jgi:hypothetical protein